MRPFLLLVGICPFCKAIYRVLWSTPKNLAACTKEVPCFDLLPLHLFLFENGLNIAKCKEQLKKSQLWTERVAELTIIHNQAKQPL